MLPWYCTVTACSLHVTPRKRARMCSRWMKEPFTEGGTHLHGTVHSVVVVNGKAGLGWWQLGRLSSTESVLCGQGWDSSSWQETPDAAHHGTA